MPLKPAVLRRDGAAAVSPWRSVSSRGLRMHNAGGGAEQLQGQQRLDQAFCANEDPAAGVRSLGSGGKALSDKRVPMPSGHIRVAIGGPQAQWVTAN